MSFWLFSSPLSEEIFPWLSPQVRAQLNCCNPFAKVGVSTGERKALKCCGTSLPCRKGSTSQGTRWADQEQDRSVAAGCTGLQFSESFHALSSGSWIPKATDDGVPFPHCFSSSLPASFPLFHPPSPPTPETEKLLGKDSQNR